MKEFTCVMCGGTFKESTKEKDAIAEMRENFGDIKKEDCGIVCNDCYEQMFPYFPEIMGGIEIGR